MNRPRGLTERERDILTLASRGLSSAEIGRELHLAESTIKNHFQVIYMKLDASNRVAAVVAAMQQGLLGLGATISH